MTGKTSLTAAAARYVARRLNPIPTSGGQAWQDRAWAMYHAVPEVRFAATYMGNAMSGALLFAGYRDDDGTIKHAPDRHPAAEIVAHIAGGPDGQAKLLGEFGRHLTVAGEGWIIVRPTASPTPDTLTAGYDWHVVSTREVQRNGSKLTVEIDGEPVEIPGVDPDNPDVEQPVAIRVWEPDPARAIEADSPVRSSLDLLEELLLLNANVKAIARSRLTGRGILLIPQGVRFPTQPGTSDTEDDLIDVLMTVAETAIRDPESAAATVPIVLEVPANTIGDFKLLSFESAFDELAIKLREEVIRRFATGLDIPAELLLGLGDANHWGAWMLTSEAIRIGVEPKLATVTHALTQQWLHPLLQDHGVDDWHRWLVWYDTAPLRVRTNRGQTALEVYDRGELSGVALRRETGFDESDAPQPTDRTPNRPAERTPEVDLPVDETTTEPDTLPASTRPVINDGLAAAIDGLIWAALSAAGRKLERTPACPRPKRHQARQLQAAELHTIATVAPEDIDRWRVLDGAWTRVPEIAARYRVDPDCLTSALDDYCRALLAAGVKHTYEQANAVIIRTPCLRTPV